MKATKHGKAQMYKAHGCRCVVCVTAQRKRKRERNRTLYQASESHREAVKARTVEYRRREIVILAANPADARHGTTTGYFSIGCRCDSCQHAQRAYFAEKRRRIVNGKPPIRKYVHSSEPRRTKKEAA